MQTQSKFYNSQIDAKIFSYRTKGEEAKGTFETSETTATANFQMKR